MTATSDFISLLSLHAQSVRYHRQESVIPCPCLTPEGYRDPEWHEANPTAPVCDENGMLPDPSSTADLMVKAFIQPSQSTRATRMAPEYLATMFGEFQEGDSIGIFPESWQGTLLNFYDWGQSGEDWLLYNGRYFTVVAGNLFPAPDTGAARHHWEIGMRLTATPIGEP